LGLALAAARRLALRQAAARLRAAFFERRREDLRQAAGLRLLALPFAAGEAGVAGRRGRARRGGIGRGGGRVLQRLRGGRRRNGERGELEVRARVDLLREDRVGVRDVLDVRDVLARALRVDRERGARGGEGARREGEQDGRWQWRDKGKVPPGRSVLRPINAGCPENLR
jgi:hypothetical protein